MTAPLKTVSVAPLAIEHVVNSSVSDVGVVFVVTSSGPLDPSP
jgi:hypothetical protein